MADGVTVTEYPPITLPFVGTDLFEVTRIAGDGLTTKCTFDELKAGIVPDPSGAVSVFDDADIVHVYQAGAKKTATIAQLKALFGASGLFTYAPNLVYFTTFRKVSGVTAAAAFVANSQRGIRMRIFGKAKVTPQINVTTLVAASNFCAGLYSVHPTTGLPDVLKYDLGQVSCATLGIKSMSQVTIDPGDYYLVFSISAAYSLSSAPLEINTEDANFSATAIGRLESTKTYVFPIGAMSGYTWTQSANAPTTPILFRVDAP